MMAIIHAVPSMSVSGMPMFGFVSCRSMSFRMPNVINAPASIHFISLPLFRYPRWFGCSNANASVGTKQVLDTPRFITFRYRRLEGHRWLESLKQCQC